MKLISREEAKAIGLKRYFTGKPCPKGHVSERFVSNRYCVVCSNTYFSSWYKENASDVSVKRKEYYKHTSERQKRKAKEWQEANRERVAERSARWRELNLDRKRAIQARRRARKMNSEHHHTAEDVAHILKMQNKKCASCFSRLSEYQVDHVIPLSRGGHNGKENIQILCPKCNRRKSSKMPDEWARELGRLI